MVSLSVEFAGLELSNPLIASAGPLTADLEKVRKLADAGIGAVVTKTGFIEEEYFRWVGRKNIFPYKPVYKYQDLNKGTLLCLATLSDVPATEMANRLKSMKSLGIPIIGSIMGLSLDGYRRSAEAMQRAGADAIELDLCCPIPEFLLQYEYAGQNATDAPRVYAKILSAVKKEVSIPVGAKSTFSPYSSARLIEGLIRAKTWNAPPDFITPVGQSAKNPGVDLDTLQPLHPFPAMGWQGELKGLTYAALAMLGTTFPPANPQMSASGGIRTGEDIVTAMALGATTVQVHTVLLDKGPEWTRNILESLREYLDSHAIPEARGLIGRALPGCMPTLALGEFMRERGTLHGLVCASVDEGLCDGCGICGRLCPEDAIDLTDDKAVVIRDRCRGCNLCVLKCARGALALENADELEQLIERYRRSDAGAWIKELFGKRRVGLLGKLGVLRNARASGLL